MQAQTNIPSQAFIHYQRRKQNIPVKNKFKQYVTTNPALQRILEGKLQPKESSIPNTAYSNSDI